MLSIAKINSATNQAKKSPRGKSYLAYLGGPTSTTRQRGDFDDYARAKKGASGPAPFWACEGAALLGLGGDAEAQHVERLAKGFHPITGEALVKGAGDGHVMGLDMTFSAPKDVSAIFAGADQATRDAIVECLHGSAKAALADAEANTVTRHGHAGRTKQAAEATVAACYTHFSSRAVGAPVGDPQLHVHAFLFNVAMRTGSAQWSATEPRVQFERKMATGALFRVELASRMRALGFGVEPSGPYFTIRGIDEKQREALSRRSKQIADYLRESGMPGAERAAAHSVAALNTREAKAEPPLPELLVEFERMAAALGITPASVAEMRLPPPAPAAPNVAPFAIDREELLAALMEKQSCATAQEALAMICERAMGRWNAAECLLELDAFLESGNVVSLGKTEHLTRIFTSRATMDMEARVSDAVAAGAADLSHRIPEALVDAEFDRMEADLRAKLGVPVSLGQQRDAALHVASHTGRHAFVEGWAGTGKTTMMRALGAAYRAAGFEVVGCCQSAAASLNLARETGIPSRTVASLLLAVRNGKARLGPGTILALDEAGMVGSREFALLQGAALAAGAKLVAIGDPKQLQPIEAGGIFRSLIDRHGKAEISAIQRQRTDAEPLLAWLEERGSLSRAKAAALRQAPEDARLPAIETLCAEDAKLARGFDRWRARFDHKWMREAVEMFAIGKASEALAMLDERGRLRLVAGHSATVDALMADWAADKTPTANKTMIAGTRAEVRELNARARAGLVAQGLVDDARGIDVEIVHRDESTDMRRFAPGDRIVFTKNDKAVGVSNGVAGTVAGIERREFATLLVVELDEPNGRGETTARVPTSLGRFDHAWCLTNHKSQGRTFDAAYVLANPAMADREWTYVAASRSRFATTIYANTAMMTPVDPERHGPLAEPLPTRQAVVDTLASSMSRTRAKGTTLDDRYAAAVAVAKSAQSANKQLVEELSRGGP
ncbi:MobF family relaxase [Massilia sp. TWP1-3-3]|uniref:MobF family relaxase n=1 Tax=Massilia sp. TWP1-3-3 TaxID=2804573 RepID=UPI003CF113F6